MRRAAALVSGVLGFLAAAAGADLGPGTSLRTLEHQGRTRTYRVHVPASYDGATPVPLVLDFHGLHSKAVQQAGISGFVGVADAAGFIVAHPDGVDAAWNAGLCCGNDGIDDVGFVRGVVGAIAAEANVDLRRVYATGLSNGGAISQRLACEAADLFAAAAPMAFPVPFAPLSACRPVRPIPVMTFMGLTDVVVPYGGGAFASAADTFAHWRDTDGCQGDVPDRTVTSGTSRCETYTRCADGVEAGLCSITAESYGLPTLDGHVLYDNPDFPLATVAWAFLSRFTLPPSVPIVRAALAGRSRVRLRGRRGRTRRAGWDLTLGDGTWWAVARDGTVLGGRFVARDARTLVLALSDAARESLVARVGSPGLAAGRPERLRLRFDRRRRRARLTGRLGLEAAESGEATGRYALRLRGPVGTTD